MPKVYLFTFFALIAGGAPSYAKNPIRGLLLQNRLDEALPLCRQVEMLSSTDKEDFFSCAWVYLRTDRIDSGESILEKQRKFSNLPEHQILSAFAKMKRKNYLEAEKILNGARTSYKGTAIGLTAEETYGEVKEAQGDMGTAGFIYKQVASSDPGRGVSQWGLGRYYLSRGDMRLAIKHLENTTQIWPKHVGSRFNLTVIYDNLDDVKTATKWALESYRLNKADPGVLEELGNLFEKRGQIKEAVKYWQKALDYDKNAKVSREKLAAHFGEVVNELMESKRYELVIQRLATAKFNVEEKPELLLKRGIAYRNLEKYDKGASDLKKYLQDRPKDPEAQRELGVCYLNLGLKEAALKLFERAVALEPENAFNHAWLGYMQEGKGDFKQAYASWQKAMELFRDPIELKRASRRIASLEKKLGKVERKKSGQNPMEMGLDLKPVEEYDE